MKWKTVRSSAQNKPETIDRTSSKAVVYVRKNIRRVSVSDPMGGLPVEMWEYEEIIVPKEIWTEIAEIAVEDSFTIDEHTSSIGDLQSLTLDIAYQQTLDGLGI